MRNLRLFVGFDLVPYKEFALVRFVDLGLEQHLSKLEAISEAANQVN